MRIAFECATLNGLDVFAADIRKSHLQAPSSDKYFITCSPEFVLENVGEDLSLEGQSTVVKILVETSVFT